jgi:hypothetical protein
MEETSENIMISATTLAMITSLRKTKLATIAERRDISSENVDTRRSKRRTIQRFPIVQI